MSLNFFTILTIISIFLIAILSFFFFVTRRGNAYENKLLAILMFVFGLQVFYSYATSFYASDFFLPWHKLLFLVRQTSFLIGPLIYFYSLSYLKKREEFTPGLSMHFLPFAAAMLFLPLYYRGTADFIIWESPADFYTTILILAHSMIYLGFSLRTQEGGTKGVRKLFNLILSGSQQRWLQVLLIGFILIWIVNLNSFALYMIVRRPGWCAYTASIYTLVVFLFINTIILILLLRPEAYYVVAKYKTNRLSPDERTYFMDRLESYMETHKPYLNSEITLEILATQLSMNPRILSQLINDTCQKNFKSYILEYRIKESMRILSDRRQSKLTVLEVLYQVGFNSKSAFNNQFKLYTNLTPLEFRAQYIRD